MAAVYMDQTPSEGFDNHQFKEIEIKPTGVHTNKFKSRNKIL